MIPSMEAVAGTNDLAQWAKRIRELRQQTVAEVARVVVGMEAVTIRFLIAPLAGGQVLLEGVPGVAKTTRSKTPAQLLGIKFQLFKFTPDLPPSDVTATHLLDRQPTEF